mgnify:CR=1 FL=1
MNLDWSLHWMKHCLLLSSMSTCPRGKVGAFIIDASNNPISAGFNGPPRKAPGELCGIDSCNRETLKIKSGASIEIGCHHAEQNAICNAAKKGISLENCTIIVSTFPCLSCARIIHHSGLSSVVVPLDSQYDQAGIYYLIDNKIEVIFV